MGTINLPGGHWEPDRSISGIEVGRAMNVLVASHDANLLIVTYEGVTYRWQADSEKTDSADKTDSEIESRFGSHPVGEQQGHDIERMRTLFRALAYEVKRLVPPGREQSKALTHLEDGSFDAVSGIARKP